LTHKVFVYGTLRPGDSPVVPVPGVIYDLGWFPGLKLDLDSASFINCEVIEVSDAGLARLDQYEGYDPKWPEDSLYIRQKFEDGFIYVYNNDVSDRPVVESGDWLEYKNQRSGVNSHLGG